MTGRRQGNPPSSDCGYVVAISVLGKVRQFTKRSRRGVLGKIAGANRDVLGSWKRQANK